jgi:hypothetical protein
MKIIFFWNMTPCSLVDRYWRCYETCNVLEDYIWSHRRRHVASDIHIKRIQKEPIWQCQNIQTFGFNMQTECKETDVEKCENLTNHMNKDTELLFCSGVHYLNFIIYHCTVLFIIFFRLFIRQQFAQLSIRLIFVWEGRSYIACLCVHSAVWDH